MKKKYKKLNWSKERKELFNRMSDWLEEIRKGEKTGFVWSMEQLLVFIEQEIGRAFNRGYAECKKDIAIGVGFAEDPEFSELVSRVAKKLTK